MADTLDDPLIRAVETDSIVGGQGIQIYWPSVGIDMVLTPERALRYANALTDQARLARSRRVSG